MNDRPGFVCPMCGSDEFMSDKLVVCSRNFDGAICQSCGTIVTQEDLDGEFCRQVEHIIDEVIAGDATKTEV